MLYLLLAIAWAAPASLSPWNRVPDLGDPLHLGWTMAWDAHAFLHQPLAIFDSNAFHPYPHSLAFADHLLPEAILVAPVEWISGNAVLASNVAVVAALWLSALAMFVLVRSLLGSTPAALLAGLMYGFNSFTLHELPRVHVLNVMWWPLALLFLDRFVRLQRVRDAWLLASCLALQGLSGTYYLVYTALLAPLWLAGAYALHRRRPSPRELRVLGVAALVSAVPVLLVLRPYAQQLRDMGFEKGWAGGADVLAYLEPDPRNLLFGGLQFVKTPSEVPHFLGLLGLVLLVVGAVRVVRGRAGSAAAIGVLALVTAALGFVFSLGPLVHVGGEQLGGGPYDWLYRFVPPLRGMASPERFGVLVPLGTAILAGIALAALLDPLPRRSRIVATAVLAVLLPLEHWGRPRPAAEVPAGADVPAVYHWLAEEARSPLVELPLYPDRARKQWALYLYFSTWHWRPIPIGRTSFYPPAHDILARTLLDFPDEASLAALARVGVDTVVVHPLLWPEAERGTHLAALDAHPRLRLLQRFTDTPPARLAGLGLGEERVYRLAAPPSVPAPCTPRDELPRDAWTFTSSGVNKPERVRDGDRRTAWRTARPQRPGDFIEVALAGPETVAALGLDLYYPFDEFPRNLVLVGEGDAGRERLPFADGAAERVALIGDLLEHPRQAQWVLRISPRRLDRLRLAVGFREEDASWPAWSVPELHVYRRCDTDLP